MRVEYNTYFACFNFLILLDLFELRDILGYLRIREDISGYLFGANSQMWSAAWLVCTPLHFTPSVALARSLGPPASSPAGAAEENKPILPCSSSPHTVGSPPLALSHTGDGAVSVNAEQRKSAWMHAIASAIAGSLRTSTAPTASRPLPPVGILPLCLVAQLSRGRRRGGARSSCGVASSAAGQRGGCPASPFLIRVARLG